MSKYLLSLVIAAIFFINLGFVSAVVVNSVFVDTLFPGTEGLIRIEIENTFEDDVTDVSIGLEFMNTPFTPIGNSEDGVDNLNEGEEEDFVFRIKSANDISPGDYQIPYTIKFVKNNDQGERTGTIGVTVQAATEISYSVSAETPVIGREGKITFKIVNKGFSDVNFVLVKAFPDGYTLLSEEEVYIGDVDSDDFETATFNVIFNDENPKFKALVEYKNFDNEIKIENIEMPVTVYTKERAIELGIIKKNHGPLYISLIITIILLWILWRAWKRKIRIRKSMREK